MTISFTDWCQLRWVQLQRTSGEAFVRLPGDPALAQEHQAYVRAQISPGPSEEDAAAGQLIISQCHVSSLWHLGTSAFWTLLYMLSGLLPVEAYT